MSSAWRAGSSLRSRPRERQDKRANDSPGDGQASESERVLEFERTNDRPIHRPERTSPTQICKTIAVRVTTIAFGLPLNSQCALFSGITISAEICTTGPKSVVEANTYLSTAGRIGRADKDVARRSVVARARQPRE